MSQLLMIPGPIEIDAAVIEAASGPPPSHVSPGVIEAFGAALQSMRQVWLASDDSQSFVLAGSGTIAMDMAVSNLVEAGDRVLLVNSGYFSDRMAEMLRRRGAEVVQVRAATVGASPALDAIASSLSQGSFKALFATHVDTSTGVRIDAQAIAKLARQHDALSVFDGVCATAAERFEMAAWQADVYLTASQKAIGLPAGLALLVASPRALQARQALRSLPPLSLDFEQWLPICRAYEERRPSYFSTPATTLIRALDVSLKQQLATRHGDRSGMPARFALHQRAADAMRAAWEAMGLQLLVTSPAWAANTLSAIRYPEGVDASLVGRIASHGVIVAGGLHPQHKSEYFRVGHMGAVVERPQALLRTVAAVAAALADGGYAVDGKAACQAAEALLG